MEKVNDFETLVIKDVTEAGGYIGICNMECQYGYYELYKASELEWIQKHPRYIASECVIGTEKEVLDACAKSFIGIF